METRGGSPYQLVESKGPFMMASGSHRKQMKGPVHVDDDDDDDSKDEEADESGLVGHANYEVEGGNDDAM